MKTFLITTIAFLAISLTCKAQNWVQSTPNIYYSGGNVGIGTTTPTLGLLQINGINDMLSLYNVSNSNIQLNAYNNVDFRIIQRSNGVMTFWTNTIERMRIDQNGNVGIGTTSPSVPLHITKSPAALTNIPMQEWDPSTTGYNLILSNYNSVHGIDYRFTQLTNGVPSSVLTFQGGNVGIGTVNPDTRLAVQGTVHSTSVVVDTNVPTPDYVFKSDYNLPSLAEIKTYTDKNHHLPGVPAAAELEKNGINLGEMNMTLLKKVEELTLYLIEQNKQLAGQRQVSKSLQDQVNRLKRKRKK